MRKRSADIHVRLSREKADYTEADRNVHAPYCPENRTPPQVEDHPWKLLHHGRFSLVGVGVHNSRGNLERLANWKRISTRADNIASQKENRFHQTSPKRDWNHCDQS